MRIIDILLKDLMLIIRDWKASVFLLIMPVLFTLLFGFAFGGFSGEEEDPRLPVGYADMDGSFESDRLADILSKSEVIRLVESDLDTEAELRTAVGDGEWPAALLVPEGFGEQLWAEDDLKFSVILDQASESGTTIQSEIQMLSQRYYAAVNTASLVVELDSLPAEDPAGMRRDAFTSALAAWENPPVAVITKQTGQEESVSSLDTNAFAHSSPGMMMQFAIAGLIGAAEVMVVERKTRTHERLLTTALSRMQILLGHYGAMFVMIFVQFLILTGFGALFLELNYFQHFWATMVLVTCVALFAASLGLLIGSFAKSEDQAVLFAMIPMFVFSGLGGAWMPLEFTGKTFQFLGHLTPVAWAMDGFKTILLRNQGFEGIWLSLVVLMGFAVGFFGLGAWRFTKE